MNAADENRNRAILKGYRAKYPFEVCIQSQLSPRIYQGLYPKVQFAYVPLPEGRYWLFLKQEDLDDFKKAMGE